MYGHEGLLRWTGNGKTYRYDDEVVQRSAQDGLAGKTRSGGFFHVRRSNGEGGLGSGWGSDRWLLLFRVTSCVQSLG